MSATDPIVIVGAGRSGTTRVNGVLGAHPDVYMLDETSFLLPRMWATLKERSDYRPGLQLAQLAQQTRPDWQQMSWWEFWYGEMDQRLDRLGDAGAAIEAAETERLYRTFAAFFVELLIPPALRKRRWGFKEIWAGGATFQYEWALYHKVFPDAHYVHSVRHPLSYLRSFLSNMNAPDPTDDEVVWALGQWVAMVRHSRTLRETGRYFEFRMEDFDAELPRLLAALGLEPHPACQQAAQYTYVPSARRIIPVSGGVIDRVEGLRDLAGELGYELPAPGVAHAA